MEKWYDILAAAGEVYPADVAGAGLRVLLSDAKSLQKCVCQIALCCLQPYVYEVFETGGVYYSGSSIPKRRLLRLSGVVRERSRR